MIELFSESLKTPNLPATVILLIVLFYWIINLLGIFDLDILSADADHHVEGHSGDSTGFFHEIFNFGDLPITIIFSFFSLFFWMGTVLCNHYLHNSSLWIGLLIFIPNIIIAMIITVIIGRPLGKLYNMLTDKSEDETEKNYSGSVCYITIDASANKMGQGEVKNNDFSINVNLKTSEGKILKRGQSALLIEYFEDKGYYLAEPYEHQQ